MQLRDTGTLHEIRSVVNLYLHDRQTGTLRGQTASTLCLAIGHQEPNKDVETKHPNTPNTRSPDGEETAKDHISENDIQWYVGNDLYAAYNGTGTGKNGAKGVRRVLALWGGGARGWSAPIRSLTKATVQYRF